MKKTNLTGLSLQEMREYCLSIGEKQFRGDQLFSWIYDRGVRKFDSMTNLGKLLQIKLGDLTFIESLECITIQESAKSDSKKYLFGLSDGYTIESVLIPENNRNTVCLSSQVGCALRCRFCATGSMGFVRNLTVSEIVGQIIGIKDNIDHRITNVVFMGMGEPFLNYENVVKSLSILNDENGFAIGARKITVSTAGVVPKIYKFADEMYRYKLAFSLNATENSVRSQLMPITKKYSLENCIRALIYFTRKSKKQVTLEYIVISGINDSAEDADRLIQISNSFPCKVNLIPYNPVPGVTYSTPSLHVIEQFRKRLCKSARGVTVRRSQGNDISAACGQLVTPIHLHIQHQ